MKSLLERNDNKQFEKERKRRRKAIIFTVVACTAAAIALFVYILNSVVNKYYTDYEVLLSNERQDSNSVRYAAYGDGILKYSRDGAAGIDKDGNILWNGSYDMNNPQADVCGSYVAVGDIGGKEWYIYNGSDSGIKFEETLSIVQVQVGRQGVVAVVLEDKDSNEIHIYNPYDGSQSLLAKIPTNVAEDGYPMDISLSEDGKKLVTSYFCVASGVGESRVSFYNFDEVGQDKVNRIVGGIEFGETLVHKVEFLDNNTICILTENGFALYSMAELPEEILTQTFEKEIKSAILGEQNVGFILEDLKKESKKTLELYSLSGRKTLEKSLGLEYDRVFMAGEDIVFLSDLEGTILRNTGSEKFHSAFPFRIDYIFPTKERNTYIFIDERNIEKVKLTGAVRDESGND